jgi:hypothetical protein
VTPGAGGGLAETDAARVREGVADAIVGGPEGLREILGTDPAGFLALVAAARVGAEEADRLLRVAVTGARQAGHSWEAIGRLLGVSRQAAQQRFAASADGGAAVPDGDDGSAVSDRRVVSGVTALSEMGVLEVEGARGWHLVDLGPLYLVLERSPRRWHHRRLTLPSRATQRRLERDGWVAVGTWFPFRYFKRAVDAPVEADTEPEAR